MNIDSTLYNRQYFEKRLTSVRNRSHQLLADVIVSQVEFETFIDVGCATGELIQFFVRYGKEGCGIELALAAREFMPPAVADCIYQVDATDRSIPEQYGHYDLAICLELAEHISLESSNNVVENICSLSDVVLFSAAPPGQGGTGHINEQPWVFWKTRFYKEGFSEDTIRGERIRDSLREAGVLSYYHNNIHLLCFQESTEQD